MTENSLSLKERRTREAGALLLLMLAVLWGVALASYDPLDPSLFTSSERIEPANLAGRFGATLAEISLQICGLGAFLFPVAVGWSSVRLFRAPRGEAWPTRVFGLALGLVGFCGLLTLGLGSGSSAVAFPFGTDHPIPPGGMVGAAVLGPLRTVLGSFGAAVALFAMSALALLLATSLSLAEMTAKFRDRLIDFSGVLARNWTRSRERNEKEAMKREVIRKHIERAEENVESAGETTTAVKVFAVAAPHKPDWIRRVSGPPRRPVARPARISAAMAVPLAPAPLHRTPTPAPRKAPEVVEMPKPRSKTPIPMPRIARPKPAPKQDVIPEVASVLTDYTYPPTTLLDPFQSGPLELDRRALVEIGALIQQKCIEFRVEGEIEEIQPGPVVTTYEFKPAMGVKYSRIVALADDLALGLKAESIRIERIGGKSTVGIEVPNPQAETISLRELFESDHFRASRSLLTLALGKDIHGNPVISDLAKMPHLLIAGTTGSGKSVGINTMISSILYKSRPEEVKLILIDPKMVELKPYEGLAHLACPIVTEPKKASNALKWAVLEMEERYRTLARCGVRNIDQYNGFLRDEDAVRRVLESAGATAPGEPAPKLDPMPFIIVIIDELADLMMTAPKEIEDSIARLAQMARAVGIHLIVATQRPSVDVITGVIKANFPCRIAFKTSSKIDSRTILDVMGAEKLLGRGDMLFVPPGTSRLGRIHGAYISEKETAALVKFLAKQGKPAFNEEILRDRGAEAKAADEDDDEDDDPMFDEAARLVVTTGQASASYLQRKLKLGYARAARLLDIMERRGLIGPGQGAKPREILVGPDYFAEVETTR